jgi:RNA 2',3'-cyclic 3'-phosphodiesterase
MRAFVALEVSDNAVLDALVEAEGALTSTGADLKTVERANLHFTIKFLGEISEASSKEADARLRLLKLPAAEVEVRGVGAFPSVRDPRVIWAGVRKDMEPLIGGIAHPVIDALDGIGERGSRPFSAHITLARVRTGRNAHGLSAAIASMGAMSFGTVRLSALSLKSSALTSSGPVYTNIEVYQLT